jgi:hypothetical protein
MDDEQRQCIMAEARERIEKGAAAHAELEARINSEPRGDWRGDEDGRLEAQRRSMPQRESQRLDTDFGALVEQRVAAERETLIEIVAEVVALERRDADRKLDKLRAEIAELRAELGKTRSSNAADVVTPSWPPPAPGIRRRVYAA